MSIIWKCRSNIAAFSHIVQPKKTKTGGIFNIVLKSLSNCHRDNQCSTDKNNIHTTTKQMKK